MSKIAIAPEVSYPAKILVEAAWPEQLTEEAQTAAQELARQLEQMQEE